MPTGEGSRNCLHGNIHQSASFNDLRIHPPGLITKPWPLVPAPHSSGFTWGNLNTLIVLMEPTRGSSPACDMTGSMSRYLMISLRHNDDIIYQHDDVIKWMVFTGSETAWECMFVKFVLHILICVDIIIYQNRISTYLWIDKHWWPSNIKSSCFLLQKHLLDIKGPRFHTIAIGGWSVKLELYYITFI